MDVKSDLLKEAIALEDALSEKRKIDANFNPAEGKIMTPKSNFAKIRSERQHSQTNLRFFASNQDGVKTTPIYNSVDVLSADLSSGR